MELRNPLSKSQLDRLRPKPLVIEFDFSDVPSQIFMGKVLKEYLISVCLVDIQQAFDDGVAITVGDLVAQGRFQAATDNDPTHAEQYHREVNFSYALDTDAYVFISGFSAVGHGRVILYLE